jgi:hypothetical protein
MKQANLRVSPLVTWYIERHSKKILTEKAKPRLRKKKHPYSTLIPVVDIAEQLPSLVDDKLAELGREENAVQCFNTQHSSLEFNRLTKYRLSSAGAAMVMKYNTGLRPNYSPSFIKSVMSLKIERNVWGSIDKDSVLKRLKIVLEERLKKKLIDCSCVYLEETDKWMFSKPAGDCQFK